MYKNKNCKSQLSGCRFMLKEFLKKLALIALAQFQKETFKLQGMPKNTFLFELMTLFSVDPGKSCTQCH